MPHLAILTATFRNADGCYTREHEVDLPAYDGDEDHTLYMLMVDHKWMDHPEFLRWEASVITEEH